MLRRARSLTAVLLLLAAPLAVGKKLDIVMETLGPYQLGTAYDQMKTLAGFKLDEGRTKPAEGIVSAKIIDRRILDTPTIQRFTFKEGKLIRVSIIFHPPETYPEEVVKRWLVSQWGDPGPKELVDKDVLYKWSMKTTTGALLPADGNRWMASLQYRE